MAGTTNNADSSAKCNTVLHVNTCCTKCNNDDWSYAGNRSKCCNIVVAILSLWSYHGNGAKFDFTYPCLSIVSVLMLY